MKMKKVFFFIVCTCWIVVNSHGQNWAGPDTVTCGELGVIIGSSDPCPGCCYFWSPTIGLSDHKIKNPTAKPKTETIYSVTVTDSNLRLKGTDQVTVGLSFGEMFFSPDHLIQASEESVVDAVLLNLEGVNSPSDITWDILSPTLGCEFEPEGLGAKITPGNFYGEITVQASKVGTPGCIVKEKLPVNNGVKDVWAIDTDTPARIAMQGETLYVVDQSEVLISAKSNPGGFSMGIPDWKQDGFGSAIPPDGTADNPMSEPFYLTGNYSEYIAGDDPEFKPKVGVMRIQNAVIQQEITPAIEGLFDLLKSKLKFKTKNEEEEEIDIPCGDSDPFEIDEVEVNYILKRSVAENFMSPDTGIKYEAAIEGTFGATGKIYHPYFTRTVSLPGVSVCSKLWAGASSSITFAMNFVSDPAMQDPDWHVDNFQGKWGIKLFSGFELAAVTSGWAASGSAEFTISVESVSEFQVADKKLVAYLEIKPVYCTISTNVYKLSDNNQFKKVFSGPSVEILLMSPYKSTPFTLYNFN
jgi:hypothetical protein